MNKSFVFSVIAVMLVVWTSSCDRTVDSSDGTPYDPNSPVVLTRFYPDSGGMATKMILEGQNFGIGDREENPEYSVKVYFNSKQAAVVRSVGDMIYAITPRQPGEGNTNGDTCVISVVVGNDSVVYENQRFMYYTTTTVSTVAGVTTDLSDSEQDDARTGGTLSEARFSRPRYLCSDDEGNIYLCDWTAVWGSGSFYLINQESDLVQELGTGRMSAPCMDPSGTSIWVPDDGGTTMYMFDMADAYNMTQFTLTMMDADQWSQTYKLSLASSSIEEDGVQYIYTVTNESGNSNNYLAKINPNLGTIEPVLDMRATDAEGLTINDENSWCFLAFDPLNPQILYISMYHRHAISRYNILTKEYESAWAGERGTAGHSDGRYSDALFDTPSQICVDYDGNLFVADANNHCIRKITQNGIVTTVIGQPGISGTLDGGPDDALFNFPEGVTVTPDNTIWIADTGNDLIRKLAIE